MRLCWDEGKICLDYLENSENYADLNLDVEHTLSVEDKVNMLRLNVRFIGSHTPFADNRNLIEDKQ